MIQALKCSVERPFWTRHSFRPSLSCDSVSSQLLEGTAHFAPDPLNHTSEATSDVELAPRDSNRLARLYHPMALVVL